ncbi:MAG: hypothetical protein WC683_10425 [bacterium]
MPQQQPKKYDDPLAAVKDFSSLSIADLLKARDLYHRHLTSKRGVLATAVGKYLIRRSDPQLGEHRAKTPRPRRLSECEVRRYSWPCLLVFVSKWVEVEKLPSGYQTNDLISRVLHLPDGKDVPVCVVEAEPQTIAQPRPLNLTFPQEYIGGGYPILTEVQGEEHVASVGCLVTDGHTVYAVTNKHVAGNPGDRMFTYLGGERTDIGKASDKQLTRIPFSELYSDWPGQGVVVNLDVGLVEINDTSQWTPQVYGMGKIGPLADIGPDDLSLRLIGAPVRAYGCASREMYGQVLALFYRYRSVGGFEYVADFVIGPRTDGQLKTHHGDSGTLWLLERRDPDGKPTAPRPLALQWGGHVLEDSTGRGQSYALATNLSPVCARLGIELIRDWGQELPEYWGTVGHFTIANLATKLLNSKLSLSKLINDNLTNITLKLSDITDKDTKGLSKEDFVPLADVPDLAWKVGQHKRGPRGRTSDGAPLNKEGPSHFADMDEPLPETGETLLSLCSNPSNISPQAWIDHVRRLPHADGVDPALSAGLLPFRCWQIYNEMVGFAKAGKLEEFVCAAGILAHYVGDACQPLHISYLHHGDPTDTVTKVVHHRDGTETESTVNRANNIHEDYEVGMFKKHAVEMKQGVEAAVMSAGPLAPISGGYNAAVKVFELMQKTFAAVPPRALVDSYTEGLKDGQARSELTDELWQRYGAKTIEIMTLGCRYLALLWESAWIEGRGEAHASEARALGTIPTSRLVKLYSPRSFLQSCLLTEIDRILTLRRAARGVAPGGAHHSDRPITAPVGAARKRKRHR